MKTSLLIILHIKKCLYIIILSSLMVARKKSVLAQKQKEKVETKKEEGNYEQLKVEEEPEFKPPKVISAVTVLLNAVQMAQQRGVYNMNEIGIIHKAYELLLEHERKRDEKLREQDNEEFIETAKELIETPKKEPDIIL